jgi:hypothetical protein
MFNDAAAVGGVGELEAENLGIVFGLLEAVARILIDRLSLRLLQA